MSWGQLARDVAAMRAEGFSVAAAATASAAPVPQSSGGGSGVYVPWATSAETVSTTPVTREEALAVPALHRAVDLISSTVASLPLRVYRGRQDASDTDSGQFLAQPESHLPRAVTLARTVADLIFEGVAYWQVLDRYTTGFPRFVERIEPTAVAIQSDWSARIRGARVPLVDVICFQGPTYGSRGPLGILTTAARTLRTAARLEEAAARYAWNEVPYGSLTNTDGTALEADEVLELLAAWETARRRRATAYLPPGLKWDAVSGPDPEKLQLTEARQYIAAEIARHLNLPPRYVGASAGDSMTYASQGADRRDLIDLAIRPWLTAIESTLSSTPTRSDPRVAVVTPGGTDVRFDTAAFLLSDYTQRADFYSKVIPLGILTVDEARAIERLPERTTSILPEEGA